MSNFNNNEDDNSNSNSNNLNNSNNSNNSNTNSNIDDEEDKYYDENCSMNVSYEDVDTCKSYYTFNTLKLIIFKTNY